MPLYLAPVEYRSRRDVDLVLVSGNVFQVGAGEKFVPSTLQVFHNGRRLKKASGPSPTDGDYIVSESGGPGSGFDQITVFSPNVNNGTFFADFVTP
jgi:hypothetical protein